MYDTSVNYGLRNPAFHDDIGMSMINRMYPTVISPITGTGAHEFPGTTINNGTPAQDSFTPTKRDKEENFIKKLLVGTVIGGLAIFGLRKCKVPFAKIKTFVTNGFNKIISGGKHIWNKIKGLPGKIKSYF